MADDKMSFDRFDHFMTTQLAYCQDVLMAKREEYATGEDALSNFRKAANIQGIHVMHALAGMMSKHTVSLYDMIERGDKYSLEQWGEKITDHINYLIILYAIVAEEAVKKANHEPF